MGQMDSWRQTQTRGRKETTPDIQGPPEVLVNLIENAIESFGIPESLKLALIDVKSLRRPIRWSCLA